MVMDMQKQELIAVGQIINTHGIKGEVKVLSLTSFMERFQDLDEVFIVRDEKQLATLSVEKARPFKKEFMIVKFKGINSINDAEKYKQTYMMVTKENTVQLPEGHYFIFDIIGLDVYTTSGDYLGEVVDIITSSNDVYVVRDQQQSKKEILLPAIKEVVKEINMDQGKMMVELIPGLIGD